MAAGLVSALLLSVANIIAYAVLFLAQGPISFRDCPLGNNGWGHGTPWFDWIYGQYLAILAGMVLVSAFFFRPAWDYTDFFVPKGAEEVCIVVLLLVGAALTGWSCFRQRKLEC